LAVPGDPGTIVVVEDDANIADLVEMYLRKEGFRVVQATDVPGGHAAVERERPRLVLLDIGLPGAEDGLELVRSLRAQSAVPILVLTARAEEVDRVVGLELGADDYVTKPFSPRELVARVKAILRRSAAAAQQAPDLLEVGSVEVDLARREARVGGQAVPLTAREFDLLAFMAENSGIALSRSQLLEAVWGPGWYGDARTVDVHVRQLRKKLGDGLPLDTVWGIGYRLG
jgi:DNA-binding response OmpR family regulator